jgi:hypothetical protein
MTETKLASETVAALADAYNAAGVSPYSDFVPEGFDFAAIEAVDQYWKLAVISVQGRRALEAKIATFADRPAIHALLIAAQGAQRGRVEAEATDLTKLCATAARGGFQPAEGCRARLKLKDAVVISYEQAAWADYRTYAVPFEGDASSPTCAANLSRFCAALCTATGIAGVGSTWEADIPADGLVILRQRSSIAD